jgi:DNA transformation protein and related proteins
MGRELTFARVATTDAFTNLCAELLSPLGPVSVRRMFGGRGFYVDGLFMALIADGQFFLKADDTTRERFVAAGCVPFSYATKHGERVVTGYYRAPEEALESPALMLPWARLAFEAALRAANAKVKKASAPAAKKAPAKKPAAGRRG